MFDHYFSQETLDKMKARGIRVIGLAPFGYQINDNGCFKIRTPLQLEKMLTRKQNMRAYITAEGIERAKNLGNDTPFMSVLANAYCEAQCDDEYDDEIVQCNFLGLSVKDNMIMGDWELVFESGNIEEFTAPLDREGYIKWK